jgi:hypothetical protein
MTKTIHENAGEVIRLMRSLGMDEDMQGRVLKAMWVEKSYSLPLEAMGYKKVPLEQVWTI